MVTPVPYTGAQYRALKNPILAEGGVPYSGEQPGRWWLEHNPARRFYNDRAPLDILLIGWHITVGPKNTRPDRSAISTVRYGMNTQNQASWHVCIDADNIFTCLRDRRVAWVQGVPGFNFNRPGLGIEIATDRTDWRVKDKDWVKAVLRNVAIWYAPRELAYQIPRVLVKDRNRIQSLINQGKPVGHASHADLAGNPSYRTDPGVIRLGGRWVDTFPWEQAFDYIGEEVDLIVGKPSPPPQADNFPLRQGARGKNVGTLQTGLNHLGYGLAVDESFGPLTAAAVVDYRKAIGATPEPVATVQLMSRLETDMNKIDELTKAVTELTKAVAAVDKKASSAVTAANGAKKSADAATKAANTASKSAKTAADKPEVIPMLTVGGERFGKSGDFWVRDGEVRDPEHTHHPYDIESKAEWIDMARANSAHAVTLLEEVAKVLKVDLSTLPARPTSKAKAGESWRKPEAMPENGPRFSPQG